MSCSRGRPPYLVDEDDDVEVDDIGTYPHLKDEDHDISMPVRAR